MNWASLSSLFAGGLLKDGFHIFGSVLGSFSIEKMLNLSGVEPLGKAEAGR